MEKTYSYKIVDVSDDERKNRVIITVDFYEERTENNRPVKDKVEQKRLSFRNDATEDDINDEIRKVGRVYFEDIARTELLKEQEKKRDKRREKLDELLNQDEQTL